MKRINHRREHQSEGALFLRNLEIYERLAELERQRENLLSLVCRILQAAPGYKLHPSELAVETVGDLSCLGQETYAMLLNRMVREGRAHTSKVCTSQAKPYCPFLCRSEK